LRQAILKSLNDEEGEQLHYSEGDYETLYDRFYSKERETFFGLLRQNHIQRVMDIALNRTGSFRLQQAG